MSYYSTAMLHQWVLLVNVKVNRCKTEVSWLESNCPQFLKKVLISITSSDFVSNVYFLIPYIFSKLCPNISVALSALLTIFSGKEKNLKQYGTRVKLVSGRAIQKKRQRNL